MTMTKQIHLTRRSPYYWRVTINRPPLNIFGPDTIPQLNEVITAIETDEQVKVVVFDSALEVFLVADDFPGDLAERYGYVNRSLPDAELDEFVDSLANRIASFDKRVISETKRFVDVASLPPDYEIAPEWDVCFASIMRAPAQERIKKLMEQGFHKPGDVENRLGHYVGQVGR